MSMTQHKIRPLWEKIESTDIDLSMTVDGVALGELKGKAEVGSVHVVCRQTRHWGSMQIKLAQGADGRFKGSLNLSKMDLSPRE